MGLAWPTKADWEALSLAEGKPTTANAIALVASETSDAAARWAFGQWELRARARQKFALADQMLFTKPGLEMATHERIAAYHASLFPADAAVADHTCGIGADTIALARRGPVVAFDIDPIHVACAKHNLAVHALTGEVRLGDCRSEDWAADYAFCDPGRRSAGRKLTSLGEYQPDPQVLKPRLEALKSYAIKLSPMLPDEELRRFGGGVEFVSFERECREALIRSDSEGYCAVHLSDQVARLPETELPDEAYEPGAFLFEADPAAIRAHALGALGLDALGDSPGYLTGDSPVLGPWLTSFRVLWHGPWHERQVRQVLRENDWRVQVVKLRGVGLAPTQVQASLKGPGRQAVTIVLYPSGPKIFSALVERIP